MNQQVDIRFSKLAEKQVRKIPLSIVKVLNIWIKSISEKGLSDTRKIAGYHDEPLSGKRNGQRSVRLNRSYRVIYEEDSDGKIILIVILEVNKHDY